MKDIYALLQTMQLTKFKFINNKYIKKERKTHRKWIYKHLNQERISFEPSKNKLRYLNKLFLYKNESRSEKLECNVLWPVCMYDHSYKSRCVSYFAFRCGSEPKILEDYFEVSNFTADKYKSKSKEANEVPSSEVISQRNYNALLIERNPHYCTNKHFVLKIKKLLEEEKTEWAFDGFGISSNISNETSIFHTMDDYIDFITNVEEEEEDVDDEVYMTPVNKVKALSDEKGPAKEKPFHLAKYLSPISPQKNK